MLSKYVSDLKQYVHDSVVHDVLVLKTGIKEMER